jgi:flagella basal body P-ring formation protein FlgA
MVVKVDIDVDGVFYGTVNVPVQLSLVRQVPVTTRELGAGHVLTAADFALEQRDIAGIGEPLASITPGGMRLKRGIGAGRALVAADVIQEGAAMRGDRVSLRATQGGAGIEADAQIVRGGSVGDLVGVTIGSSPAVLQGRLVAPGQVVLQ